MKSWIEILMEHIHRAKNPFLLKWNSLRINVLDGLTGDCKKYEYAPEPEKRLFGNYLITGFY